MTAGLPTYPISIIPMKDNGDSGYLRCCCGLIFYVAVKSQENLVPNANRELKAVCPGCHGTANMTPEAHLVGLFGIQQFLQRSDSLLRSIPNQTIQGWYFAQHMHLKELINNAQRTHDTAEAERQRGGAFNVTGKKYDRPAGLVGGNVIVQPSNEGGLPERIEQLLAEPETAKA